MISHLGRAVASGGRPRAIDEPSRGMLRVMRRAPFAGWGELNIMAKNTKPLDVVEQTPKMAGKEVGAVVQALNVLRALSATSVPVGVTAVARVAGVNPSTTLNILRTLVGQRMVAFDSASKTYRLDYGLLELSRSLLNKSHVSLLSNDLKQITTQFDATATVWQIEGDRILLLDRAVSDSGIHIQFPVASRMPVYGGALGRIVAALSNPPLATLESAFVRIRWNTPISFERYLKEVELARQKGFAIDSNLMIRSVTSVASAITDQNGVPRLGVTTHTFLGQLSPESLEQMGQELKAMCERARRALFGDPTG